MITDVKTDQCFKDTLNYVVRSDDTIDEALVFLTENTITFPVPFGEGKKSYNKKSFSGARHYLT